ncbi:MAG TPA: aminotransferase class III-fold pyridoxal phosphate-dependent enzyme, partial [Gemmataceae bacterium]
MTARIEHPGEPTSNAERAKAAAGEPLALRTYTPSLAVLARSAGVYHWTPEGRRLYDFTSGVLVANLGHNPVSWMDRFCRYMGWSGSYLPAGKGATPPAPSGDGKAQAPEGFFAAVPMTAYNAVTPLDAEASRRLLELMRSRPGGGRMEQVMWAASGSEAIQKALWAAMASDRTRPMILATRHGFHGKKGLAGAVTGTEADPERDPRVRFIGFPTEECRDVSLRDAPFDPAPYRRELDALARQFGRRIGTLITEPYLGGGGSYHPHPAYLQMLQGWCRENDVVFILDEVQANFGRTGELFAYETYGLEPDIVVLGKGLGNGVPVAAAVGRRDLFAALGYGEGSDTWSANPLCCAAVLATLDEFAASDVLGHARRVSALIEEGLVGLKELPFVANIRGERGGMVWGVEFADWKGKPAADWANAAVLACYRGDPETGDGVHLLGTLAKKVLRVA